MLGDVTNKVRFKPYAIGRGVRMRIAVASGKGGTGKTLVATCIARVLADFSPVLLDADVEEPNAGLVLPHKIERTVPVSRPVPAVNLASCTFCGECAEICNFNALAVLPDKVMVFNELCHSCGACAYLCPEHAIKETEHHIGVLEKASLLSGGTMVTGRLVVGEPQSPPLIKKVKEAAGNTASYVIVDCPPGTTCPMIEAIQDSDFCLLIVENTPFGLHDLALSLEACRILEIPCGLVINRWYGGDDREVKAIAEENGIPILGRIPFSTELARCYAKGDNPLEVMPEIGDILENVIKQVEERVN